MGTMEKRRIDVLENGIYMTLEIAENQEIRFLHCGQQPFCEADIKEEDKVGFRLVEMELAGYDRPLERHGTKYAVTSAGCHMLYISHRDYRNEKGRRLEIFCCHPESAVCVTSYFQFYDGLSVVRTWTEAQNRGDKKQGLSYLSIFNLNGLEKGGLEEDYSQGILVHKAHNAWQKELVWRTNTLSELGLINAQGGVLKRSSNAVRVWNTGNWSAKEYLPMGGISNKKTNCHMAWQIEHNGSWYWELAEQTNHVYLQLSGPTENESHFFKWLHPGDTFVTPTAAIAFSDQAFENTIQELVRYRRLIRRPNEDNERLPVIFNDYMNCLWADPTTEKEIPLIDAAAAAGCEYFVIDAGWYDKGFWWDSVGQWLPSTERFPGGIEKVLGYIREKGMIPGLWLEIEVMGINSPMAEQTDDSWFFVRHGRRIYDRSRYQLDFRSPKVRAHATETIRRLVEDYGVGYIKMDYNIEPGIGTERDADSFGDGLLQHERAYLSWLDEIFEKYPQLVIENCSSGGLRMDYGLLSRCSIQSTSDQENYLYYATISANAAAGVNPEQAAVWSYPLVDGDVEETIFNMVNALLLRIHQSGHLANLSAERRAVVAEALDYYKTIRQDLKNAVPFWPLGFSDYLDEWVCYGMKYQPETGNAEDGGKETKRRKSGQEKWYLAVFRREGKQDELEIPLPHLKGKRAEVRQSYPLGCPCSYIYTEETNTLWVELKEKTARLFEIAVNG